MSLLKQNHEFVFKRVLSDQIPSERVTKYQDAKLFSEVPTFTKLQMLRSFFPGGLLYKASFAELNSRIVDKYGDIFLLPGMFGKPQIAFIYDPLDIETLCRTEGIWPNRRGLETLEYYRKTVRPDIYEEVGGLFNE